jgi:two-component system response regulator DesR
MAVDAGMPRLGERGHMRILFVADVALLSSSLATALSVAGDSVTCHRSVEVTPDVLRQVRPEVAVIDLDVRRTTALAAVHTVAQYAPDCGILVLTGVRSVPGLRKALESDVSGFMYRDCDIAQLSTAIKRVAAGERFIDPGLALAAIGSSSMPLTERELDVLRLAADGLSAAEIARALFLSPGTVRNYLSTTSRKLGVRTRVEAVRTAVESNWL